MLSSFSPFILTFDELEVSQRVIIIKTRQSDELNKIRAALLACIQLPKGTKNPPNITHSTLARFTKPLDLEEVVEKAKWTKTAIVHRVTEFALVKDLEPPIFNGTAMECYPLSGQTNHAIY